MRNFLLLSHLALMLLGVTTILVGGFFLLADWAAGDKAWAYFQRLSGVGGTTQVSLLQAFASQQAHRINFWGELLGMLAGALLVAVGLIGLELNLKERRIDRPS